MPPHEKQAACNFTLPVSHGAWESDALSLPLYSIASCAVLWARYISRVDFAPNLLAWYSNTGLDGRGGGTCHHRGEVHLFGQGCWRGVYFP